jgi:CHAT domain-containing protein
MVVSYWHPILPPISCCQIVWTTCTNWLIGSKLSDFVTSSYTPTGTLTALLNASNDLTPSSNQPELLIVAETSSYGQMPLPGTHKERLLIEEQVGKCTAIKSNSLIGAQATAEHVAEGLKTASWVHFACHGVQHSSRPTESALLLAGHSRLTLQDLMQLNLSHRDMAFLSACQTAKGDERLSDEAVHLAAGMLMAGYRGVIATMWSVMDQDAPQVTRDVYGHLFTGKSIPDPTEALHMHFILLSTIFVKVWVKLTMHHFFLGCHSYIWGYEVFH